MSSEKFNICHILCKLFKAIKQLLPWASEPKPSPELGLEPEAEPEIKLDPQSSAEPKKPPSRGGKRKKQTPRNPPAAEKSAPDKKPELMCRGIRNPREWQIFLSVPAGENIHARQGALELTPERDGECKLSNYREPITWTKGDKEETIALVGGTVPLMFKLRKNWKGDGRRISSMNSGHYIVFAPKTWQRLSMGPIEPSQSTDGEFLAYYFDSDSDDASDGFEECESFIASERFSLRGRTVHDDADMGDLYVGDIPQLYDSENWRDIPWMRVGEEGGGTWAESFKPVEKQLADVLDNREGWFFLRFYDENTELIHSMDFRYLAGLKKILVGGSPHSRDNIIKPSDNGHIETIVRFVGEVTVQNRSANITVSDNTASVAPHPDLDETQWRLVGGKGNASINIHLPRIWWQLVDSKTESGEWRSTSFEMGKEAFSDDLAAKMVISLPSAINKIQVGFDQGGYIDGPKVYRKERGTNEVTFPLRHFRDRPPITEGSSEGSIFQVQCSNVKFTIVRILPTVRSPKPPDGPVNISQQHCLRPYRGNKRFSRAECEEARLTDADVKRFLLAVDSRRATKHERNIKILTKLQGGHHAA